MESPPTQAPPKIVPEKLADYLDVLSKSVFQTGMSWRVIDAKWPGTREAFDGFEPGIVASYSPGDVERLADDKRIVRNRRKIEATIHNAQTMLDLEEAHAGFQKYLRSFPDYDALVGDMRKRFKFVGEMGAYFFLYSVSEPVPDYHECHATHGRR
jgi:3-methyladenine DNA glycosylase Tag